MQKLQIYGHRGARGLSPENTLPAYRTALEIGVDYVDMDVGMTREGVVVVAHGIALEPHITRDASGQWITSNSILVKDLTLAELQNYDVGRINPGSFYRELFPSQFAIDHTPMPTLKEVIGYIKKNARNEVGFQIEIKNNPEYPQWTFSPLVLARAINKILEEEEIIPQTIIQAFDYNFLLELQKINPQITLAFLTRKQNQLGSSESSTRIPNQACTNEEVWTAGHLLRDYNNSIPQMIAALGGSIWGAQDIELTTPQVKEAHQLGLKVVPWSLVEQIGGEFDHVRIENLIRMRVDGIITDRPDIMRGIAAARGLLGR